MSEAKNKLIVVSAPSGCGKGTILERVFDADKAYYSVSCTTRKPREGEENGRHYFFITNDEFERMIADNRFLEYAGYADHYYGTPRSKVEENLAAGKDVILEIETKGAFQVKKKRSDAILLFILPPSVKELDRRLHKRGTETEEVISKRLDQAVGEIKRAYEYDYVIMNDELEDAVRDFETVINAERNKDGSADRFRADNEDIKNMIGEVLDNA